MKYYGLDVHKDFIQVCELSEDGKNKKEYKIDCTRENIEAFGESLSDDSHMVLEATFHSWAIYTILSSHVERVVVANPLQVKAIAYAKIKTDKVDAHILAQLLRTDFIPEVKMPREKCWEMRQLVTHRKFLSEQKRSIKASIQSIFHRKLVHLPKGNLATQRMQRIMMSYAFDQSERVIFENLLDLMNQTEEKIKKVEDRMSEIGTEDMNIKLLMTIPGVSLTIATAFMSAIDNIDRFDSPDQLASYFGLVPRISQSGHKTYLGKITKSGRSTVRWLAVEAAHNMAMNGGPMSGSFYKIKSKKGYNIAVVALARKLVVLTWHILKKQEPYRYAPMISTREKLKKIRPDRKKSAYGKAPKTLNAVYEEAGIPVVKEIYSKGEKRAVANGKRLVTRLKPPRKKREPGVTILESS